jgi:hypothetical protein
MNFFTFEGEVGALQDIIGWAVCLVAGWKLSVDRAFICSRMYCFSSKARTSFVFIKSKRSDCFCSLFSRLATCFSRHVFCLFNKSTSSHNSFRDSLSKDLDITVNGMLLKEFSYTLLVKFRGASSAPTNPFFLCQPFRLFLLASIYVQCR